MRRLFPIVVPILLLLAVAALSVPLVLGFLGSWHPALDAFSHFRLHLAATLLALAALLLFTRFRRDGAMALALGIAAFAVTPGTYASALLGNQAIAEPRPGDRAVYRLLQFNARYDNPAPEAFLSLVGRLKPDVITLDEVERMWRGRLASLSAAYPHRVDCPGGEMMILSRRPFSAGTEPECSHRNRMAIATIDFGGQAVEIVALHLFWPWPFAQPAQVSRIAPRLAELGPAAILAGDFNAVAWSETVARVAAAARMREPGTIGPTWLPRQAPDSLRRIAGLGIDHILVGAGINVHAVATTDAAASDHLPVLLEFSLPGGAEEGSPDVHVVRGDASKADTP
ncbi:MAG: endonuclease/exonuclease/phosphatase family protein, partial [Mesorhizobium sp.]|nr:endonuclease/exonuclease/phosphatase family protein [Mesorhizobium sp.]